MKALAAEWARKLGKGIGVGQEGSRDRTPILPPA